MWGQLSGIFASCTVTAAKAVQSLAVFFTFFAAAVGSGIAVFLIAMPDGFRRHEGQSRRFYKLMPDFTSASPKKAKSALITLNPSRQPANSSHLPTGTTASRNYFIFKFKIQDTPH
jgi:hypothetical protein